MQIKKWGKHIVFFLSISLFLFGPTFLQWIFTPEGTTWTGFDVGGIDYYTYLAKIDWGRQGHWTYLNRLTPEDIEPAPIYAFYLALGHLSRLTGWSPIAVYHGARVVLGLITIAALTAFFRKEGLLAVFLAIGASGLGLGFFGPRTWERAEFFVQGHLYLGFLGFPHYMLTLLGLLAVLAGYRAVQEEKWRKAIVLSLIGANLIALNHPFLLLLAVSIPVTHAAVYNRKFLVKALFYAAVVSLMATPLVLLMSRAFWTIPWLQIWREQAKTISVPFPVLYLAYGGVALAALWGAVKARGWDGIWTVWAALAFGLAYSGILKNGLEFTFFISVPLAALAAQPLNALLNRLRWWARPIAVVLVTLEFILLTGGFWVFSFTPNYYIGTRYLPEEYLQGLEWLRDRAGKGDVVLSPLETGNLLPYWTGLKPYIGHHSETLDFTAKAKAAQGFYEGWMTDAQAESFLKQSRIKWVIEDRLTVGQFTHSLPEEKSWRFTRLAYSVLQEEFKNKYLTIYEVVSPQKNGQNQQERRVLP